MKATSITRVGSSQSDGCVKQSMPGRIYETEVFVACRRSDWYLPVTMDSKIGDNKNKMAMYDECDES